MNTTKISRALLAYAFVPATFGLALAPTGCVTTGTHKAKLAELDEATKKKNELDAQLVELERKLQAQRLANEDLERRLAAANGHLKRLGQNVEESQQQLAELAKQKAAAEARAATFRTLVEKLRSMIDAGQIKVTIRNGRMLIALPNDVLFDSGKTAVKTEGREALAKVGQVLAGIGDRRFVVAGHTDNVPIKTARFASNWNLSTARAVEVTGLLVQGGMKPGVLGAAGYGEFDPVAPNETPEGRAQNRRIEIVLEPNLSDLPSLEGLQGRGSAG